MTAPTPSVAQRIARLTALNSPCPCGEAGWVHTDKGCLGLKRGRFRLRPRHCGCPITTEQHIANMNRGA